MPGGINIKFPSRRTIRRSLRSLLLIPIVLAVVGAAYLYGRLIEVNWIKTKRVDVPIRPLPPQFDGFKIVQLSDLHIWDLGEREKKLPAMVNAVGADAIFITGDFAHDEQGMQVAAALISQLQSRYGIWGVLGNWDSRQTVKACKEAGVKMLLSEVDTIEIDGALLGIIGLKYDDALRVLGVDVQRQTLAGLKSQLPADIPVILLEHEPRIVRAAQDEGIDLVLSGHTHGGQVRIPFGPAIETPSDMGIWYTRGMYQFKNTLLYINPGIGLEPGPDYIKVRFFCRPEITVLTLRDGAE